MFLNQQTFLKAMQGAAVSSKPVDGTEVLESRTIIHFIFPSQKIPDPQITFFLR